MASNDQRLRAVGTEAEAIVVIARLESDESASTHAESSSEDLVFKKAGNCFRATAHYSHNMYRRGGGHREWLTDTKPISPAEFASLAAGHTPVDLSAVRAQIAQRKSAIAAEEAARPTCPKCGAKMTARSGPTGTFWGCSTFPKCKGTKNK